MAPVGELRRRWVTQAAANDCNQRYDIEFSAEGKPDESSDNVVWSSSVTSPRCNTDPLFGSWPQRFCSRFWEDDAASMKSDEGQLRLPSTTSLCRKAKEAGFSSNQINETMRLLADPENGPLIVSKPTPTTVDRPTIMARKIVATLFHDRDPVAGSWKGPLPSPRVSPPLRLGDCPVTDQRGGSRSCQ